jgi:hypothetical protein
MNTKRQQLVQWVKEVLPEGYDLVHKEDWAGNAEKYSHFLRKFPKIIFYTFGSDVTKITYPKVLCKDDDIVLVQAGIVESYQYESGPPTQTAMRLFLETSNDTLTCIICYENPEVGFTCAKCSSRTCACCTVQLKRCPQCRNEYTERSIEMIRDLIVQFQGHVKK